MDVYLGRCMKNWAADREPPVESRRRLLKAAASLPVQQEQRLFNLFSIIKDSFFSSPDRFYTYYDEWPRTPITQSSAWYFHISLNWRSAT
ncbi:MAG: hypothetical protein JXA78_07730 [Anaerolineales bacterium]|nr:hypothetical protein [Anaerolineales bacterium]